MWRARTRGYAAAAAAAAAAAGGVFALADTTTTPPPSTPPPPPSHTKPDAGSVRRGRRRWDPDEVARHRGPGDCWVTLGSKVYDLSRFVDAHPGGRAALLEVAGGAVDSHVAHFAVHLQSSRFLEQLETSYIGDLSDDDDGDDGGDAGGGAAAGGDSVIWCDLSPVRELSGLLFADEPARDPALLRPPSGDMSMHPFTAEPRGAYPHLQHTPTDSFFVRNHAPVPRGLRRSITLLVETKVDGVALSSGNQPPTAAAASGSTVELDLDVLEARHGTLKLASTIQCAGNRLDERARIGKTIWDPSRLGSKGWIGNAVWEGVELATLGACNGHPRAPGRARAARTPPRRRPGLPRGLHRGRPLRDLATARPGAGG